MATNEARFAPAGWIATAVTSGAVAVSFAPMTRAATACDPSSGVPSGSVRVTMTGVSGPAQMLLDTTSTRRSSPGPVPPASAAGVAAGAGATADGAAACSASSPVTSAVIGPASVPNGNRARRVPAASTRNTSAVWAIP